MTLSEQPPNLVEMAFWEDEYFAGVELPSRPDPRMPFERCLAVELTRHARVDAHARVLEVGCAPAKWLVYYAETFDADVEGIEYSAKGASLSRANLRAAGVEGEIRNTDFFAVAPRPFDLVLSLGFIEHFNDVAEVFRRHLEFVGPQGRLAIGVPNFHGLNRFLQRWSDPEHLRMHNLEAMNPALYRRLAAEHGLELDHLGYLGGFDPVIIKLTRRILSPIILAESLYRRLPFADRLNHRWLSSYLLAVFRRR